MGQRLHLVLKFTDSMYDVKDVILLHNRVALIYGAAWMGKPYYTMGKMPILRFNEQIEAGFLTRLYLIDEKRKKPIAYFADLLSVTMKSPKEKELIPAFYKEKKILSRMKVWIKCNYLEGFYLDDFPALEKQNRNYELAVSFADRSSKYFILYEEF